MAAIKGVAPYTDVDNFLPPYSGNTEEGRPRVLRVAADFVTCTNCESPTASSGSGT